MALLRHVDGLWCRIRIHHLPISVASLNRQRLLERLVSRLLLMSQLRYEVGDLELLVLEQGEKAFNSLERGLDILLGQRLSVVGGVEVL